jgi:hypothetical protein
MYIHKELFEDNQYHKYIFTIHDYKENATSSVMKESENKGFIVFIVCFEDLNCVIMDFNINYEQKGYGTILLNEVISILRKKYSNIRTIELDDMTDRYRQPNNIYVKFGFTYKQDHGPEMVYIL